MNAKKPLNPVVLIVVIVVGMLVFGAAGYFVAVKPQGAKVKSIKRRKRSLSLTPIGKRRNPDGLPRS